MTAQDIFYITLSIGFIVLVGFICFAAYQLAITLKSLKILIDNAEDITKDVQMVKNQLKSGVVTGMTTIISLLTMFLRKKGGGKSGR